MADVGEGVKQEEEAQAASGSTASPVAPIDVRDPVAMGELTQRMQRDWLRSRGYESLDQMVAEANREFLDSFLGGQDESAPQDGSTPQDVPASLGQ